MGHMMVDIMKSGLLIASLLISSLQAMQISLLYSKSTPFNVSQVINLCPDTQYDLVPVLISFREKIDQVHSEMALDYLYDEGLSVWARGSRKGEQIARMWGHFEPSYEPQFSAYLLAFNFSRVLLVADTSGAYAELAESIRTSHPNLYGNYAIIPTDIDIDFALQFVGRNIKSRGISVVALLVRPLSALHFLQALEAKKLNKPGFAYILSQEAGRYRYLTRDKAGLLGSGGLIVGEDYDMEASWESLEARRLWDHLNALGSEIEPAYGLYYTNSSNLMKAASRPADISTRTQLLFPGQTTAIPRLGKPTIPTSVNYQWFNPDLSNFPQQGPYCRGYNIAFEEVNNRTDMLPDYHLLDYSVGFTGLAFNYNFTLSRVQKEIQNLGLIHFVTSAVASTVGTVQVFRDLNVTIPMATGGGLGSILSNPKTYPLFLHPRVGNPYLMKVLARMIHFFGWTNVATLYGQDKYNAEDSYVLFLTQIEENGINIINPVDLRGIPAVLNNNTNTQLNASLTAVIESSTRILIIFHAYHFTILERLYDLGVRSEYVILLMTGMDDATYLKPEYVKRRVVSKGALMFTPKMFVGEIGQRVKQELIKRDGTGMIPNTCSYYDSAYLYFYATDYLLERGMDYEDPFVIVKAMRETYFHGCSGFIKVEKGSNDRDTSVIVLSNFQYNDDNDSYTIKAVGAYDPLSIQPYQINFPVQWPDDQPTYADSKPSYFDCPFLAEVVRDLLAGKIIGLSVDFAIALVTLVATVLIWRRWWNVRVDLLTQKHPIMTEDVLVLFAVVCDYFQFAAVGPNLANLSHLAMSASAALGYDMERLINITNGVYWIVLDTALALVVVWTLICFLKFTRLDVKLGKICSVFDYWTELLMPTLGNLLFLPIISTLTNVYLCFKSTSDSLKDSFLNKDCYEYCWRSGHIGYAIGSGIGLMCYIPLAVFTRPLWQELQHNVHVKAQPLALMVKSAVQVFLIVLSNTLKRDDPSTHAYIFIAVISLYLVFLCCSRQYNYDRLNLWQILIMFAMLSLAISAHITSVTSTDYSANLVSSLAAEYALLGGIGLGLQLFVPRFGARLVREKSRDVRGLFRFAFTWGNRAQAGLAQFYTDNSITVPRKSEITNFEGNHKVV